MRGQPDTAGGGQWETGAGPLWAPCGHPCTPPEPAAGCGIPVEENIHIMRSTHCSAQSTDCIMVLLFEIQCLFGLQMLCLQVVPGSPHTVSAVMFAHFGREWSCLASGWYAPGLPQKCVLSLQPQHRQQKVNGAHWATEKYM